MKGVSPGVNERCQSAMKGVSPCICAVIHVQNLATVRGHMHCHRTCKVAMFFQKDKFFHFCTYARTDPFPDPFPRTDPFP